VGGDSALGEQRQAELSTYPGKRGGWILNESQEPKNGFLTQEKPRSQRPRTRTVNPFFQKRRIEGKNISTDKPVDLRT